MPLSPPPLDENNSVKPHNHPEILDSDSVIRRISEQQHIVDDPKVPQGRRVSTKAFKSSSGINGGMSIDLKTRIEADGLDAVAHVTSPEWIGSVVVGVQFLRNLGLMVGYDPIEGRPAIKDNLYHGEVWGNFTKSIQKQILSSAIWFVEVPNVYLNETAK